VLRRLTKREHVQSGQYQDLNGDIATEGYIKILHAHCSDLQMYFFILRHFPFRYAWLLLSYLMAKLQFHCNFAWWLFESEKKEKQEVHYRIIRIALNQSVMPISDTSNGYW